LYKFVDVPEIAYHVIEYKIIEVQYGPNVPDSTFWKFKFEFFINKQLLVWLKNQKDEGYISKYIYEMHKKMYRKWQKIILLIYKTFYIMNEDNE
jgi:hypothetical protein